MSFSFRASRIIEDTLNTLEQAEEAKDYEISLEEYARVMMVLSDELQRRAHKVIDELLEVA